MEGIESVDTVRRTLFANDPAPVPSVSATERAYRLEALQSLLGLVRRNVTEVNWSRQTG